MALAIGIIIIVLVALLIAGIAYVTTKTIPLSSAKDDYRPPAMSWIQGSWIGAHWFLFNAISAGTGIILGFVALFLTPYGQTLVQGNMSDPDLPMSFLILETAVMLGFHVVWSSVLDWRYHKIPRWPLVFDMIMQLATTITCVALSVNWKFLVLAIILVSIMCWLTGTLPGSGMSDGRIYVIMACIGMPFMGMACWMPVVLAFVLAIINAIVSSITGGALVHSERKTNMGMVKRLLTAKSPMGPFITTAFTLFFILITTGVIHPTIFTAMV